MLPLPRDGLDPRPAVAGAAADLAAGVPVGVVAARSHAGLAAAVAAACAGAAADAGVGLAVLSGGVFQNRLPPGRRGRACRGRAPRADPGGASRPTTAGSATGRRRRAPRGWRRAMFGLDDWVSQLADGQALLVVLAVALLLGLRHASDPDHLAAASTLIASEPGEGRERAGRLGLAWGLGTRSRSAARLPIVLFGAHLPDSIQRAAEAAVGLMIMFLALRLLLRWRRGQFHAHAHSHGDVVHRHLHPHEHAHRHDHPHEPETRLGARRRARSRSASCTASVDRPAWGACSSPASRRAPRRSPRCISRRRHGALDGRRLGRLGTCSSAAPSTGRACACSPRPSGRPGWPSAAGTPRARG